MNYTNGDQKRCRVCQEKIEISANKCIHCDSYQNWRRYLVISNSMIALLTALISVTALSSKHILALFQPEYSAIGALAVKVSPENILLVVANNGNRSGAILESQLTVSGLQGELSARMVPTESYLINAGQVREITLNFINSAPPLKAVDALKGSGEEGLDYLDCSLDISLLQYQSMNEVFSKQQNDIERLQKEMELRSNQARFGSQSVAVPKYGIGPKDKVFLDINCKDLFVNLR